MNLNRLNGRDILRYKNWRSDGINTVTLKTQLSELREFLRFCVSIDAVEESVPEKVTVPSLDDGENVRETLMRPDEATTILQFLEQYHYASLNHVLLLLLWQTGARMAGIHSIDVDDIDAEEGMIEIRHRPNRGTRLKNESGGERIVAVPTATIAVVEDYIDVNRPPVTDEYGREPLITTAHGRIHNGTLRSTVYKTTRPCQIAGNGCPGNEDPETCEAALTTSSASKCPYNYSPHAIRKGSITWSLKNDVPAEKVGARMNVSTKALEKHYDMQTKEESMEARRNYFRNIY
jgi:integrase